MRWQSFQGKAWIKNFAMEHGADVCGIGAVDRFRDCPAEFSPAGIWDKTKSVVAVGIALPKGLFEVPSRLIYGMERRSVALARWTAIAAACFVRGRWASKW